MFQNQGRAATGDSGRTEDVAGLLNGCSAQAFLPGGRSRLRTADPEAPEQQKRWMMTSVLLIPLTVFLF